MELGLFDTVCLLLVLPLSCGGRVGPVCNKLVHAQCSINTASITLLWIQLHYLWSKTCLAGCSANHFFDQRMAVITLLLPNQPYQWLSNLSPMLPPFFATALFLCHFTRSLPNHHRFSAGDSIVVPIIVDIAMLYSQYCGVIG